MAYANFRYLVLELDEFFVPNIAETHLSYPEMIFLKMFTVNQ